MFLRCSFVSADHSRAEEATRKKPRKTLCFSMFFAIPHLRALSENHMTIVKNTLLERFERPIAFDKHVFCIPDPQNGRRGLSAKVLEAPLATFWALLAALGRPWARLGRAWGALGTLFLRSWGVLGSS